MTTPNLTILSDAQAIAEESYCVSCDAPGTHQIDDQDPHCVACVAKFYSECVECGRLQLDADEDVWLYRHYPGSRDEPPFWEVIGCVDCTKRPNPRERGDDDGVEYGHPREVEAV